MVAQMPKTRTETLTSQIALTTPQTRMVAVVAWMEDDEPQSEVVPVVAIRSSLCHQFTAHSSLALPLAPTPELMLDAGWELGATYVADEAIVVDPDSGLLMPLLDAFDERYGSSRLVVCPWERAEDAKRIASVIDLLTRELAIAVTIAESADR